MKLNSKVVGTLGGDAEIVLNSFFGAESLHGDFVHGFFVGLVFLSGGLSAIKMYTAE